MGTLLDSPRVGAEAAVPRALVLAGGGMRVAYQAGVIRALREAGLSFELFDGASGGTINLAMLLSGHSPETMCERWRTLEVTDFAALLCLQEYFAPGGAKALGSAEGIREKVFPHLGIDVDVIRRAQGICATFNVCNYTDKLNEAIPHTDLTIELLVAGVSLPMFTPAIEHAGKTYVDAVWIRDANLTTVVEHGAQEIWLVWCIGNVTRYGNGLLQQYVHMIEICANAALFAELQQIARLNAQIAAGLVSPYGQTRPIRVHIVKPEIALPLDPDFFIGNIDAATLISMGYSDAWRAIAAQPRPDAVELGYRATKMRHIEQGISFREVFSGPLCVVGGTMPAGLAQEGPMRLRAVVRISDLSAFMEDPTQGAELHGSVDLSGVGEHLPLADGTFSIERVASGGREVRFAACVRLGDESLRLVGRKLLYDDRGPDMLDDVATLVVELLPEFGKGEDCLARGTLRLDVGLTDVLASVHPWGDSGVAAARRVAQFWKFYLSELSEEYVTGEKAWWKFW